MVNEDTADVLARRSIAIARGVIAAVVIAYSLSADLGAAETPSYARVIGVLAGGGLMISAIAEFLARLGDDDVRRRLILFDALLVAGLMVTFIEDPSSYEGVVVAWAVVEAGTILGVRKSLTVAVALAIVYVTKEIVSARAFDQDYDVAGVAVRVATFAAIALVTSSYAAAVQSRRLLSQERGRSIQLRELDEAKTMFIRAVAHDFRSPLSVITGMAELMVNRADQMSADQLRQLSSTIVKNGRKLETLVGDLMDSQRLSQGVLKLERTETDLSQLIQVAVDDVDMKDHPVSCDLPSVTASVDAPKLERVIENLLVNAAKHTDPGTQVWVSLHDRAEAVIVAVEDAGGGVPDELKEEIFQPFVQGTENSPGTGVGLSLVRGITELHGGRAWVEDREGGGSVFRILLPKARS